MSTELSREFYLATWTSWSGTPDRVDGADIVETTTGDKVSAGRIGTSHDPARTEGDGVYFVGRVGVPNDEFTIL